MVVVSLELHEKEIQFSPPLSPHSSQHTVPEVIRQLLEKFLSLSKIAQRLAHTDKVNSTTLHIYIYNIYVCNICNVYNICVM